MGNLTTMIEFLPNYDKQVARESKMESFNPRPGNGLAEVGRLGSKEHTALDNAACSRTGVGGYSITFCPLLCLLAYHALS